MKLSFGGQAQEPPSSSGYAKHFSEGDILGQSDTSSPGISVPCFPIHSCLSNHGNNRQVLLNSLHRPIRRFICSTATCPLGQQQSWVVSHLQHFQCSRLYFQRNFKPSGGCSAAQQHSEQKGFGQGVCRAPRVTGAHRGSARK